MDRAAFHTDWQNPARCAGEKMPLQPRKQPRQGRSIALVDALKAACRRILMEEGAAELSAARLAELSGVCTASIYEYFPKLEALVAQVLRETITDAYDDSGSVLALPGNTPLEELLGHMVHRAFHKRALLAGLHPHLYLRYMHYFEVIDVDTVERLLQPHLNVITLCDTRLAAIVVTTALAQLPQTLLRENPLYLHAPETEQMVVRMLHAALGAPQPAAAG